MVIFPVVGRAKSWDIAGPVLGVTALPASTPITQSVKEFIISTPSSFLFVPWARTIEQPIHAFLSRANTTKTSSVPYGPDEQARVTAI